MENFSEKKQRGRPRLIPPRKYKVMQSLYPSVGHRSVQNAWHGAQVSSLKDFPEFAWLFTGRKETLHTELGRIEDTASFIKAARWLCKEQPTVKDGVVVLRRWRKELQGKDWQTTGEVQQLSDEISQTIEGYLLRYPATPLAVIREALEWCMPDMDDEEHS